MYVLILCNITDEQQRFTLSKSILVEKDKTQILIKKKLNQI